jgi:hypothetical protein
MDSATEGLFAKLEALHVEWRVMKRKHSVYASSDYRDRLKVKTAPAR